MILRGKVDSFYQKQMIQESLRKIEGIECIANLIGGGRNHSRVLENRIGFCKPFVNLRLELLGRAVRHD